jgi:hypothetical protein
MLADLSEKLLPNRKFQTGNIIIINEAFLTLYSCYLYFMKDQIK